MVSELSLQNFLDLMALKPVAVVGQSCYLGAFTGLAQEVPSDRVFGGLLVAQAIVAAGHTTPESHRPLSIHADFLGAVAPGGELRWEVEAFGKDKSISTRRSTLRGADGAILFSAISRWGKVRVDIGSFDAVEPYSCQPPEQLRDLEERFVDQLEIPLWWRMRRPVLFRHAQTPAYTTPVLPAKNFQTVWVRGRNRVPADPIIQAALLAYITDMSILEPAFQAVESVRHAASSRVLSLSHSLVFHTGTDLSDWHQFDSECRTVAHGRAVAVGEIFDRDGKHIGSAKQLGLIKFN